MGGEVLLVLEKGEVRRLRRFFDTNPTVFEKSDGGIYSVEAPTEGDGCWIEFRGGNKVQVGYQVFDLCSEWALAVACGIRDNFKVSKGGWGSIGYSKDFFTTHPFRVKIRILQRLLKKTHNDASLLESIEYYRKHKKMYTKRAKEIFKHAHAK